MAQVFETVMLVCFGVSWPFSIARTLRVRKADGKSLVFLALILIGYMAGVTAKIVHAAQAGARPEAVTALYALNACLVCTDLVLCARFRSTNVPAEETPVE